MLQRDFIAYGLNSKLDRVVGADAPQSHLQAEASQPLLPDPRKEDKAFIQNAPDTVFKTLPDQLHREPRLPVLRRNLILTISATKRRRGRPQKNTETVDGKDEKSPRRLRSGLYPTAPTDVDALSRYPSLTPPSPTKRAKRASGCVQGSM
jgi:hypothetical protein